MMRSVIILGAGGHARVLIDTLLTYTDHYILGITERTKQAEQQIMGINVLGCDDAVLEFMPERVMLVNGLGFLPGLTARKQLFSYFKSKNFEFLSIIHPAAVTSSNIHLGMGVQLMAGSIVQIGCHLGDNVIVNTKASIDHDCYIGANAHIAPGATLCGHVTVGENAFIGSGATIAQGVHIGENSIVAAGAVVVDDVIDNDLVVGVPARSKYNENMVGCASFGRC